MTTPPGNPTAADLPNRPSFNHAALDRADIDDARRGYPAVSLQPFAAANGLGYTTNQLHGGFLSSLPKFPDYVFNVCHGTFPGGRLGLLQHELLELVTDQGGIRGGGTYHHVRIVSTFGAKELLGFGGGEEPNAPFVGNYAWLPITSVHLRVPALNQLPTFTIRNDDGTALFSGRSKLGQYGLPGFLLTSGPKDDAAFMSAISGACAPALSTRRDTWVRLQVHHGVLSLTVNGYRADDADLHHLTAVASHIADSLTTLTRDLSATGFLVPGPAAAPPGQPGTAPQGVPLPHPSFVPAYAKVATERGMLHENPHYLSHLLPRCPIPGIASGVLFGTLPGTTTVGRLVWFEHGSQFSGSVRAGVIVPATEGAATPLGGSYHAATGIQMEVVDGVAYCWQHQLLSGRLGIQDTINGARTALAEAAVATI